MKIPKLRLIRESTIGKLDEILYAKVYHSHQQEYIRRRLKFIKCCLTTELTSKEISLKFGVNNQFYQWLDKYQKHGLLGLCKPATRIMPTRISQSQKLVLKEILLTKSPNDFGYDRNIWTGTGIIQLLMDRWNINYKDSRVYQILDELELSHQKAHRDYVNSDPDKAKKARDNLEKK